MTILILQALFHSSEKVESKIDKHFTVTVQCVMIKITCSSRSILFRVQVSINDAIPMICLQTIKISQSRKIGIKIHMQNSIDVCFYSDLQ